MEIFRIRLNSNVFQSFLPVDSSIWETDCLTMDCTPKKSLWKPPEIYLQNPMKEKGNFFHLCSGAFVVDRQSAEKMWSFFEIAGELLPLTFHRDAFFLLNVLECMNCLDLERTKWIIGKTTGAKIRVQEYFFDKKRLPESTLFKIPETAKAEIFCIQGIKDPEDEFKTQVEINGFSGLLFEKVWSEQ